MGSIEYQICRSRQSLLPAKKVGINRYQAFVGVIYRYWVLSKCRGGLITSRGSRLHLDKDGARNRNAQVRPSAGGARKGAKPHQRTATLGQCPKIPAQVA